MDSDEDHNEQVLDETFRNHPGIRGAVTFNSSCYILGGLSGKAAEARDSAGRLMI